MYTVTENRSRGATTFSGSPTCLQKSFKSGIDISNFSGNYNFFCDSIPHIRATRNNLWGFKLEFDTYRRQNKKSYGGIERYLDAPV
jgi:hypothetical protein